MILYRGESVSPARCDQQRVQLVKQFHMSGQGLWTKLANGGNPYELIQLGVREALQRHIGDGSRFANTHFLSFTRERSVALEYARTPAVDEPDDVELASHDDIDWDHTKYAVFELHARILQPLGQGVSHLSYNSATNQAVLINAVEFLGALPTRAKNSSPYAAALRLATAGSEWLVLPVDPIADGTLSALLPKGSDLSVQHYVGSGFFTEPQGAFS